MQGRGISNQTAPTRQFLIVNEVRKSTQLQPPASIDTARLTNSFNR